MIKHSIIPIFVPHLGCPHDCVFCNQRRITNSSENITYESLEGTIKEYLNYFKPGSQVEIAFYGGSFTAIDRDLQNGLLAVALEYKSRRLIDEIRLSTRPDAIDKDILENLKSFGVNTIELGVQSLDDTVLNASGRGHSSKDVYRAVDLIKSYGFKLGLQMMVGLPKDSIETNIFTAKEFINLKADFVRIYPTLVIKDTFLADLYKGNKYKPLSLDEAVDCVTPLMMLFYLNDIDIIRVGLQTTENIQLGKDVISGPFHPSFRQLVDSNIYKEILSYYLDNLAGDFQGKELEIFMNSREVSNLAGQRSSNIMYLREKYLFKKVKINPMDSDTNSIRVKIGDFSDTIIFETIMEKVSRNSFIDKI